MKRTRSLAAEGCSLPSTMYRVLTAGMPVSGSRFTGANSQPFSSALRSLEEAQKPTGGSDWPGVPTDSAISSEEAVKMGALACRRFRNS